MERVIRATGVNIVIHPHSAERYAQLLTAAGRLRRAVKIRGDRYGMLLSVGEPSQRDLRNTSWDGSVLGVFATFTELDSTKNWINLRTGEAIEDGDPEIPFIPKHVRPNRVEFRFRFYLRRHLLVVETRNGNGSLSPSLVEVFLQRLFRHPQIVEEFGEVRVNVVASPDALREIWKRTIKSIEIVINTPNHDHTDHAERDIEARLEEIRAKRLKQVFTAKRGQRIEPDTEMKRDARIASRNGYVKANVTQQGTRAVTTLSTNSRPLELPFSYDPGAEHEATAFDQLSEALRAMDQDRDE